MNEFELEVLLSQVCIILNIPVSEVKSASRKSNVCDARKIFAYRATQLHRARFKTVAKVIQRHRTSIYSFLDKYLDYLQYDPKFREKSEKVRVAFLHSKMQA